ncbi:MAG: aldo/keto reductase [Christensenellaceae bacterium]|jgi:diketogulonate reductase-like aldo/keto reductase|nr:aldo/keto reductase [Christensenellaceae bacterium]
MKTLDLGCLSLPVLGQGGWYMGDDPALESSEGSALRLGLEKGLSLIDTAEMYGSGRSESLIGRALEGIPRESYLLCSKVYPHNAGHAQIFKSCEASLRRLKTEFLDLYLLHWRGSVPLEETIECMEELVLRDRIRRWGVSNLDLGDMRELLSLPGGERCAVNQILYHLGSRGAEYDLLPYLRQNHIAAMAYCPLAQAGSLRRGLVLNPAVGAVAKRHETTPFAVLLAFVLRQDWLVAIPKAGRIEHVLANAQAAELVLDEADLTLLDGAFPPPTRRQPLDIV